MKWQGGGSRFTLREGDISITVHHRHRNPGCEIIVEIGGTTVLTEVHHFEEEPSALLHRSLDVARDYLLSQAALLHVPERTEPEACEPLRRLLAEYYLEIGTLCNDSEFGRYSKAQDALGEFTQSGKIPTRWIEEATAPASQMVDDAYRDRRVRAVYYLLHAIKSRRPAAQLAIATELLELQRINERRAQAQGAAIEDGAAEREAAES